MHIVQLLKKRKEIISLELEKLDAILSLYADVDGVFQETDFLLYNRPQKKRLFQSNIGQYARAIAKELALENGNVRTSEVVMELKNKGYALSDKDGNTRVANYLTRSPHLESSTSGWRVKQAA